MKIQDILNENAVLAFRDLEPMQTAVLNKIGSGRPLISQRENDIMDNLIDLGLVDLGGDITDQGVKTLELVKRYGTRDARAIQQRTAKLGQSAGFGAKRTYTGNGDGSELLGDESESEEIDSDAMRRGVIAR